MSVNAAGTSRSPVVACIIWLASISWIVFSIKINHVIHRAPQWFLRSLKTAGLMTFSVYLIHQVAGNALMGFVVKAGFDRWTALCSAVFVTLFVSWIVAKYLEPALQVKTKAALFFGKGWWAQRVSALTR
jgi:peptidoglycan/LPS O-acetylase OafA/YrhL